MLCPGCLSPGSITPNGSASDANPSSGAAGNATAGEEGAKDPADVWEFTEGDLDNVGGGATTYGSDDEWSYASVSGETATDIASRGRCNRFISTLHEISSLEF